MSRPKKTVPGYLHHKATGRAFCLIRRADGTRQTIYLGPYDSEESRQRYARVLAGEDLPSSDSTRPAGGRAVPEAAQPEAPSPLTVARLISLFVEHVALHHRRADGTPTSEPEEYHFAFRPLLHLFAALPAHEFGPRCLKAVRSLMVEGYEHPGRGCQRALCRRVVNARVGRIVRMFKWAVGEELLPPSTHHALAAVRGLQQGRTVARESEPILPVSWEHVEKTLPHLNPVVRAMVLFQWHTGCRPGEVCSMRVEEIDRTGEVWLYKPTWHKLSYLHKVRVIVIGKQGQEVLAPFLDREGFLFCPAEAVENMLATKRANRKSKVQPSQICRKKPNPMRKAGERYKPIPYLRAVERAAKKAGVPHWHPNQLRHSFATRVRAAFGLEAAQVLLGHSHAAITEIYAEKNVALARSVAEKIG